MGTYEENWENNYEEEVRDMEKEVEEHEKILLPNVL